ncbi:hypothetical protein ACO2RV_20125 [Ancylobacter sp. VNQ12]|uniref:hypothetical protein n=1 Tax=Ancylobacter sp. VNQ12 TaxID=3400920 RepID=UPI003C1006B6
MAVAAAHPPRAALDHGICDMTDRLAHGAFANDFPSVANGPTPRTISLMVAMRGRRAGIEHRFTRMDHRWTDAPFQRMTRTSEDAPVKGGHYDGLDRRGRHLQVVHPGLHIRPPDEALKDLSSYEFSCQCWTSEPERFTSDPNHPMPGLST